jgi:hypothetical protein
MASIALFRALATALLSAALLGTGVSVLRAEPAGTRTEAWIEDLSPIGPADWSFERARHLLDRGGFGGTPEDIEHLARMTPEEAVRWLVEYQSVESGHLKPFEPSGVYDPSLKAFPESRPAATRTAAKAGRRWG